MEPVWERCLERLRSETSLEDFHTWLAPLRARREANAIVLLAPNPFVLEEVEKRFRARLEELIGSIGEGLRVQLRLDGGEPPPARSRAEPLCNTDPNYTFESFVEGKSNELARAAAWRVAHNPGRDYNPLLLYGGTGLGKTHLMHACGNLMHRLDRQRRVLYLRSEQFFAAMMKALADKSMDQFRRQFHTVDALLIDDIQFFAGKERTQEEFFHTFNALFDGKQQIVLTCDRYPKEYDNLEPRLKSRLGWGLSVAIEPPDFETRAAILLSKARARGIALPEEVAFLIARRMRSNVRDLEGALNTLSARAAFLGRPITVEFAQETLRDLLHAQEQQANIANIQRVVAEYYRIRLADLLSRQRSRSLVRARQMAMALARELTDHSLPEIGDAFGGRDHTTVLHACEQIARLRESEGRLREDWERLLRMLSG
ncbi:MAG: chromosomal replication initiator protein DnaA [Lysobacterales bacterium]|jgi:chromosomal replication initiator protein|nr:MAG: chromosomal replication initiator protein DnaA [Xanthomonadales bacterium]